LYDFVHYVGMRTFVRPDRLLFDKAVVDRAAAEVVADVRYHLPDMTREQILSRVVAAKDELAVFLYRLSRAIYEMDPMSVSLNVLHAAMKEMCACEIYYSNAIGEGLLVVHGEGTVIGSRNRIGKGFKIYQNSTIGHRVVGGSGNTIGDDVIVYTGARVIGELVVGDRAVIAANTVVTTDVPPDTVVTGVKGTRLARSERTHIL
jgi:serine O-acetyltransferase